ncbi:MAG: hypothetical protein IT347_12765 [Candidatus Eisenbacteria bacterium]|nr:hypothetical protein [Candidatus Eisenbacteria bacterium]
MFRRLNWLIAFLFLIAAPPARAGSPFPDWSSFHGAFTSWSLDSSKIADVRSLMLQRETGTFVLEEGRLALAKPLGGRRVAAVFVGRGSFVFAPRSKVEREQLRRFYETPVLRRPFGRLTLIVSDTTFAELMPALQFRTDTLGELDRAWQATFPNLTVRGLQHPRPLPVAQMLLDGADNGLFWSYISDRRDEDPLFFSIVPDYTERVVLERRPEDDRSGLLRRYNAEVVSQAFAAGDPDTLRRDLQPGYEAVHYALDVTLTSDLSSTVTADIALLAHGRPRAWIGLRFPPELKLDRVSLGGREQAFFQEAENPMVWVRLDRAIEPGAADTLKVRYHGLMFERRGDWIYHRFPSSWYPEPWYGSLATWDLTFHHPRELQVIGSGEKTGDREDRGIRHSTWRTRHPAASASFDVSFLRGIRVVSDSLPPLTVWLRHVERAGQVEDATLAGLRGSKDHDRRTALDVAHAFQFFEEQLGPPLAASFNAVETPLWVYVAYPGLVHLMMREDKMLPGPENTPDVFRAHEVSHQWFGLGMDHATYHDAWLSEGFADFCSIWYLQASRKDARNYFKVLESWRDQLVSNRRFAFGRGQKAGPVWLGTRSVTSATPEDYRLVVYAKGAWVLHMLRNYLLEDSDPGETRFRGMLRDFYTRFRGRRAFTEDFRAAVERATGEDMGWFFEQWVYGADVPVCRFAWKVEPAGDRWKVTGRIEQTGVPESFRYPVFLRVDFADGRYSRQRVWVRGPVTEFELPLSPQKPAGVVFNDLDAVLCEMAK